MFLLVVKLDLMLLQRAYHSGASWRAWKFPAGWGAFGGPEGTGWGVLGTPASEENQALAGPRPLLWPITLPSRNKAMDQHLRMAGGCGVLFPVCHMGFGGVYCSFHQP